MDELQAIMDKEIEVERLRRVRDVFVFSCWTGLAYIDVYLLKDDWKIHSVLTPCAKCR